MGRGVASLRAFALRGCAGVIVELRCSAASGVLPSWLTFMCLAVSLSQLAALCRLPFDCASVATWEWSYCMYLMFVVNCGRARGAVRRRGRVLRHRRQRSER